MPSQIDERTGGVVTTYFGPGMEGQATITEWDPPRSFAADSHNLGENAPSLATEWYVEARSGGVCVVRVVHSLFTESDEWDDQLEGMESGWPVFFEILRMYLSRFRGQTSSNIQLLEISKQDKPQAWDAMLEGLGLAGAKEGDSWRTTAGAPSLSGKLHRIGENNDHLYALAFVDQPTPGICSLIIADACGKGCVQLSLYLYGKQGEAVVEVEQAAWESWFHERLS